MPTLTQTNLYIQLFMDYLPVHLKNHRFHTYLLQWLMAADATDFSLSGCHMAPANRELSFMVGVDVDPCLQRYSGMRISISVCRTDITALGDEKCFLPWSPECDVLHLNKCMIDYDHIVDDTNKNLRAVFYAKTKKESL